MLTQATGQTKRTEPRHLSSAKAFDFHHGKQLTSWHASRNGMNDMSLKRMTGMI
jgi:hypothetical protein